MSNATRALALYAVEIWPDDLRGEFAPIAVSAALDTCALSGDIRRDIDANRNDGFA
jgi:hypothetical protein